MNYNSPIYRKARAGVRVTKRGPGDYAAYHNGSQVMRCGRTWGKAITACATAVVEQWEAQDKAGAA